MAEQVENTLGYFVWKEDTYVRDDLHLKGKGAAVFSMDLWTQEQVPTISTRFAGEFIEKPNTGGTDKDSKPKAANNCLENSKKIGYKCICLKEHSKQKQRTKHYGRIY